MRLFLAVTILTPALVIISSFDTENPEATATSHPDLVVTEINGPHDTHSIMENSGASICANVSLSIAPTAGDVKIWIRTDFAWGSFWTGVVRFQDPMGAGSTKDTGITFNASNFSTPQQVCVVPRDNDYADGNWDEATQGTRPTQKANGEWWDDDDDEQYCDRATEWCYGPAMLLYPQSSTAAEYDCDSGATGCPNSPVAAEGLDPDLVYPWYIRIVDDEQAPHYDRSEVGTGNECTQADPCTLTEGVATQVDLQFGENPHWAMGGLGTLSTATNQGGWPPGSDPAIPITDTDCTQTSGGHSFTLANWETETATLEWTCADNGVIEHPQPVQVRLYQSGVMIPWVGVGCGITTYDAANHIEPCQFKPTLHFLKVDPNLVESMVLESLGGNDTCANVTIPYENTGNIAIQLTVTHGGTVTHSSLVAAGASGTLDGVYTTAVDGELMARFTSTYDGSVLGTRTKDLDCRDQDGDGYTADIDCNDDDAAKPGAPAGYQLMQNQNGTPQSLLDVCGLQLRGYPASIIRIDPLPECAYWEFDHPSRIMVRVFMLSAGNGNPAQAVVNEKNGSGLHQHDYGLLWIGSQIDHDGNTGPGNNNRWKPRGFNGHDVYSSSPIRMGYNPNNNLFSWYDPDNNNQTWRDGSAVPAGKEPYLAFVHADETVVKSAPVVTVVTDTCTDTDGDGIYDFDEETGCENDADCDDDGVNDGNEGSGCIQNADCDDDGLGDADDPNDFDTDTDDDGVTDGDEEALSCVQDTDCDDDGVDDDDEPDGCATNADCDSDSIIDGNEQDPTCIELNDCDNDGLDDVIDGDDLDPDQDNDTINDGDEKDGCINVADCDGDGIDDNEEQSPQCIKVADCDADGLGDADDPNDTNPDVDDDGVKDGDEEDPSCITNKDCDNDGLDDDVDPDDLNPDIDGDNVLDGDEPGECINDADCDDDGITDDLEQETICMTKADCDEDGLLDADDDDDVDPDQDGDNVPDGEEEAPQCIVIADCDGDGTFDADDPDDLNPNIPETPPEDGDGDGVTDENEQDDSCINDPDCDDDGLGDLPDEDDLDPDQDDDGVLDGDEQAPICINDPDCDNDGTTDNADEDDLDSTIPVVDPPVESILFTDGEKECKNQYGPSLTGKPLVDEDGSWTGECTIIDIFVQTEEDCAENEAFDPDGNNGYGLCIVVDQGDGTGGGDGEQTEEPDTTDICPEGAYYDVSTDLCLKGEIPPDKSTTRRVVDFLFAGWGALMLYPIATSVIIVVPWYLRFSRLLALAGGSGPWWIIVWKRRRWWCCACDERVDKDDENCEECGHIFTDDYDKYRRYLSKKDVSFSTFRQYLGLVWAKKADKDALKRLQTEEDYVISLIKDTDTG